MCILLYVKLIQCSSIPEIYGQLEGEGQNLVGVVVFHRSMINWWGGRLRVHLVWKNKNVKMTLCSTPLGHQMPLAGEQLIWWGQVIWKDDIILLLATRCLYWGAAHLMGTGHLKRWPYSALDHKMLAPGVSSSEGTLHCKIWAHFEIYSCFTEVFSTKDQQARFNFIRFCLFALYDRSIKMSPWWYIYHKRYKNT